MIILIVFVALFTGILLFILGYLLGVEAYNNKNYIHNLFQSLSDDFKGVVSTHREEREAQKQRKAQGIPEFSVIDESEADIEQAEMDEENYGAIPDDPGREKFEELERELSAKK